MHSGERSVEAMNETTAKEADDAISLNRTMHEYAHNACHVKF